MDVAKSIPALAIFALPGGGILLPILIKVLPFNILPSSFQDEPHSLSRTISMTSRFWFLIIQYNFPPPAVSNHQITGNL